jgi:hypothetical protein
MPISFSCPCGKQLRVADEHAGKRVRCPSCGETALVPGGAITTAPAAAPAMLRFRCACGQSMQARAEYAGDEAVCPACQARVTIPGAARAEPPAGRPRKRSALLLVLLGVGVLLVLGVGGGLAGWWFFFRDSGADLDLVPANAQVVVSIRVADVWKTDAVQDAFRRIKDQTGKDPIDSMRDETGLEPADIERLTVVAEDVSGDKDRVWVIVLTRKAYDKEKLLGKLSGRREMSHEGRTIHTGTATKGKEVALHFVSRRVFVVGPEQGVKRAVAFRSMRRSSGPLDEAIKLARGKKHVVVGVNLPAEKMKAIKEEMTGKEAAFKPLADVRTVTVACNVGSDLDVEATLQFAGGDAAREARGALENGLKVVRAELLGLKAKTKGQEGLPDWGAIDAALESIKVEQRDKDVVVRGKASVKGLTDFFAGLVPATQKVSEAAARAQSMNNMKQITLALHNYNDAHRRFPPATVYNEKGVPIWSWRVELLPFLGEDKLYNQFRRDEPWNGPNNFRLLSQMPKVYALPGSPGGGRTPYQVFVGPGTLYPDRNARPNLATISAMDGTSNTIFVVEANQQVSWSAPMDLFHDPNRSMKLMLLRRGDRFLVGMCDASVRSVSFSVSDATLRNAINPGDGQPLGKDWD